MTENWDLAGYVRSSRYRVDTIRHLGEHGPSLPSEIAEAENHALSHVSRALAELREQCAVELLVPEERQRGRIYGLTETGRTVADDLLREDGTLDWNVVAEGAFSRPALLSFLGTTVGSNLRAVARCEDRSVELVTPGAVDPESAPAVSDAFERVLRRVTSERRDAIEWEGPDDRQYVVHGDANATVVALLLGARRGIGISLDADCPLELPQFVDRCRTLLR